MLFFEGILDPLEHTSLVNFLHVLACTFFMSLLYLLLETMLPSL